LEATHEHRVFLENLADGRPIVVLEVCGDSFASSSRLDAQGGGVDAKGDGETMLDGTASRFPTPTCPRDASHYVALCHRKDVGIRTSILDEAMNSYLNTENIERSRYGVEYHPLRPFLPENAKVLFLGSFPPQRKRWCMDFYYPNYINDHWRIEGQIFFGDKNHFVDVENKRFKIDEIVAFCKEKGLAFFDTSTAIRRLQDNASDKFLEVVEPTDIPALLQQLPHLRAIVTTGEKATETICASLSMERLPKTNESISIPRSQLSLFRLPSSSRAYPLSFDKKVEAYRQMFQQIL
jgi:G:T/U-mismatch repair DNA glycosylase